MAAAALRRDLLGIYLNDHLAGSAGGSALANRIAESLHWSGAHDELVTFAEQVQEDRESLLTTMSALGVRRTFYKEQLAIVAERVGRLKLNGSIIRRSPLSSLVELEAMALGITGKRSAWRLLRELCDVEPALDSAELDRLITRADSQLALMERLRVDLGRRAMVRP